jgi:hypothetical protein
MKKTNGDGHTRPIGRQRPYQVVVSLSFEERARVEAEANLLGMSKGDFLRESALAKRRPSAPVPMINLEKYGELARLSLDLNQLKIACQGKRAICRLLERLSVAVTSLRQDFIGIGDRDDL